jgi:hypothetical protein
MKTNTWIVILIALLAPVSAHAYLDPGSGAMLLQVILGGVAAVGVALKLFWHKIRVAIGFGKRVEAEEK